MARKSKIEKARQYLLGEIVACFNCRPWVEDEIVWYNPHTDLDDLLIDFDLNDDEWEIILENLKCPNCEHPLETRCDQVEIKSEYDYKVEKILRKIENEKIVDKLFEFNKFLSLFPYLGLSSSSKTGRQIFNLVKNGKAHLIESEEWYRARKLNTESRIFLSDEMGAPDPNKVYVKEGRYNHTGQSFLYLSNFERTAFLEIKEGSEDICAMQKYEVKNLDTLLDLRSNYDNIDPEVDLLYWAIIYNGLIGNRPSKTSWKPEYFVPRFIADAARYFEYNGIIYSSAVSEGDNLVLFKYTQDDVFPVQNSYSYKYDEKTIGNFHFI
jgi:hypothetical protein